ncbi:MAG: M20/M25/M40 family metallo-hydrolase [Pirellulales bacterium]|nr:M20/M25/M40 family metallo-hydrolase [Pirellulales bacterium]
MKSSIHDQIAKQIGEIEQGRIRRHVETLAGFGPRSVDDPATVQKTLAYLEDQLVTFGYAVSREPFGAEPYEFNLLASTVGKELPNSIVELGGHYDTVRGSPGADDNGSAVAGVLEIARVLRASSCRRTIRFCLFGAEESGLRGSRAHVDAICNNSNEEVDGIVVFEMIGFRTDEPNSQSTPIRIPIILSPPRVGNFVCVVSNFRSRRVAARFQNAARRYVPDLPLFVVKRLGGVLKDGARSDHRPYWDSKRRGIMLSDTANFRNPHYHQPTDLPDTLDYSFAVQIARATAAMLIEWAGGGMTNDREMTKSQCPMTKSAKS